MHVILRSNTTKCESGSPVHRSETICKLCLLYVIKINLCSSNIIDCAPMVLGDVCLCMHYTFSDVTMKRLLENMFCSDTPSDVVIVSGISVLLTAIEKRFDRIV